MGKGSYDEIGHSVDPHQQLKFTVAVIASQVVGFLMIILGGSWMGSYHGGYGWDIATVFNYHPLFMTMGMIFLYGDGKLFLSCLKTWAKKLPTSIIPICEFRTLDFSLHFYAPIFLWIFPPIYLDPDPLTIGFINTVIYFNSFKQHNIPI
jgi:hypothetical protein